ncbi:MAG: DUF481 domain-containing protein [Chlorobi bacterium]|nr:DUF481 domain-containing protein [Chlorobiota bacterium]
MKTSLLLFFLLTMPMFLYSRNDSLVFYNGNVIAGEIKLMDKGVLVMETDYSDTDFKIELKKIKEIYTSSFVTITLSDGTRHEGTLRTTADGKIHLTGDNDTTTINNINDIVLMKSVDKTFSDRLHASIALGVNLTKANNFRQFSSRSNIGYLTNTWSLDSYYNTILSNQDDADSIKRIESGLLYKMLLPKDWYLPASLDFLSNTEQNLRLRTTFKIGAGKYIVHTNSVYWAFLGGANLNSENYSVESTDRTSMEGFLGTEFNMFDLGDLNLLTSIYAYPSFTEKRRWRSDFIFDMKYDLPLDFYISLGITINYDNQPVENAKEFDYILNSGLGWEW